MRNIDRGGREGCKAGAAVRPGLLVCHQPCTFQQICANEHGYVSRDDLPAPAKADVEAPLLLYP